MRPPGGAAVIGGVDPECAAGRGLAAQPAGWPQVGEGEHQELADAVETKERGAWEIEKAIDGWPVEDKAA